MIMGRFPGSLWEACPCWLESAGASGTAALAATPAATAPSTEVFTKSRREKLTHPPSRVQEDPHDGRIEHRRRIADTQASTLHAEREEYHEIKAGLGEHLTGGLWRWGTVRATAPLVTILAQSGAT